jgi:O-methyltransferase involved in polyketide biosynthesis
MKTEKDFSSVSPSAKMLLLLKGMTNIPYMRQAAELASLPEKYVPDYSVRDASYWGRVLHFEYRYNSINQLLEGLGVKNVFELSSGFSFRGLDMVMREDVHYIDTDLPELIAEKQKFLDALREGMPAPKGKLEMLPLNAVDSEAFEKVAAHFDKGPVAVVNEGLLMYLNMDEKKKLCANIKKLLQEKGGWWITADIYTQMGAPRPIAAGNDDRLQKFLEQHQVQDNMFESFEAAEAFFKAEGFVVEKEAEQTYDKSELLHYMMESLTEEQKMMMGQAGKIHVTWLLRVS